MKHRIIKRVMSLIFALALLLAAAPGAAAYYSCDQKVITSATSGGHVNKIMADLERQSFESESQREAVKKAVTYLLTVSKYSAIGQGRFPYLNANGYADRVNDGVYDYAVYASGCYAYAKWASQVVYGEGRTGTQTYVKNSYGKDIVSSWALTAEGLKTFLQENCQAGEHMRIDYVHSLCFLACTDEGVYFADYSGDAKPIIRLCYATYEAFFNAVRTGSSFWLSDVVTVKNGEDKEENPGETEELPDDKAEVPEKDEDIFDEDENVFDEEEETPDQSIDKSDETVLKLSVGSPYIIVNGEKSKIDNGGTTPVIVNNRTLLPIACVIRALGGEVAWNGADKTVSLSLEGKKLNLRINQSYMWDAKGTYKLDTPPVIMFDRTMVPVRAVVEYFGADVSWEAATKTATITYPGA